MVDANIPLILGELPEFARNSLGLFAAISIPLAVMWAGMVYYRHGHAIFHRKGDRPQDDMTALLEAITEARDDIKKTSEELANFRVESANAAERRRVEILESLDKMRDKIASDHNSDMEQIEKLFAAKLDAQSATIDGIRDQFNVYMRSMTNVCDVRHEVKRRQDS